MNTSYLHHAGVKQEVIWIWSDNSNEASTFFTRMRKFLRFYKPYCKSRAVEFRRTEEEARASLAVAQEALQIDPQNQTAQLLLARKQAQILSFESQKVEGQRLRFRLRWRDKGDSMSREFREGELRILDAITARISPLMANPLGQLFSESELHTAACALAREKAPDPDGTSVKFFTLYWPQIGADFHRMIQNAIRVGRFPNGMTKGLITFIPKSGDLKLLNNLKDAEAAINVNGHISPSFRIERGVRQGCPVAPLLFLIMDEALHAVINQAQERGNIKGVQLPRSHDQ